MAMGVPGGSDRDELDGGGGIFADINITPLTDIFLVLLIIFMVTTTAMAEAGRDQGGLEVSLPKAGRSASVTPVDDLPIAVLADGRLVVRGKVVTEAELETVLAETRAKAPGTMVLVQADAGVAHGRVVAVMDLARKTGLERLAIATQQAAE